jgi:hypothetical protein|eukprot:1937655-Prymnesium_polylepis.1
MCPHVDKHEQTDDGHRWRDGDCRRSPANERQLFARFSGHRENEDPAAATDEFRSRAVLPPVRHGRGSATAPPLGC